MGWSLLIAKRIAFNMAYHITGKKNELCNINTRQNHSHGKGSNGLEIMSRHPVYFILWSYLATRYPIQRVRPPQFEVETIGTWSHQFRERTKFINGYSHKRIKTRIVTDEAASAMIVKSSVTNVLIELDCQTKDRKDIRCMLGRKILAMFADKPRTVPASMKINTVQETMRNLHSRR